MNKRIFVIFMALIILFMNGCQLAKPDGEANKQTDRLVGVFVTTDYLDLFNMDAYMQDNMAELVNVGTVEIDKSSKYQNRIYAELNDETYVDITGKSHIINKYKFKNLEGMILACFFMQGNPAELISEYWASDAGEGMSDVQTNYKTSDNGVLNEINGKIFVAHDTEKITFYINPVYQTLEGDVYLLAGGGLQVDPYFGGATSKSLSESVTIKENNKEQTYSSKIDITIDVVELANKVILIQMDENNFEICRDEFKPGHIPDEFTPKDNAAYIIIEEHRTSGIFRSIHQNGFEPIEVFFTIDGDICIKEFTNVNWENAEGE